MYLIVGSETDPLSQRVADTLRGRGRRVAVTPEPLAGAGTFSWRLDDQHSQSNLRLATGPDVPGTALRGVLVRAMGRPTKPEGWSPDDFAYVQSETQAALLAWLWSLPCVVVNRPTADLWFRPERSYLEWRPLLVRSGLPTLSIQIGNDPAAARAFADRWSDAVVYAPLTSFARYAIDDEQQWAEVGKVMAFVPVCLVEPSSDPTCRACLVGREVIWDGSADPGGHEREVLERGLRRLATALQLEVLEIEVRRGRAGLCCVGVNLYPNLESYADSRGELLAARVADTLDGSQGGAK